MATVLEQALIGVAAGVVWGLYGYFSKREWDPAAGWEQFNVYKIGRTVVVWAAAGALVGYMGEPITEGRIEAATATTAIVGEFFDRLVSGVQRQGQKRATAPA